MTNALAHNQNYEKKSHIFMNFMNLYGFWVFGIRKICAVPIFLCFECNLYLCLHSAFIYNQSLQTCQIVVRVCKPGGGGCKPGGSLLKPRFRVLKMQHPGSPTQRIFTNFKNLVDFYEF